MRWSRRVRWGLLGLVTISATSCSKVPLYDIGLAWKLADVAWFEAEETLFIFYEMQVDQGLNEESTIEVRYTTDTEILDWTPIEALPRVHMHVPADCGEK